MVSKKSRGKYYIILVVIVFFSAFAIFNVIRASSYDNEIKVSYAKINAIHTGTGTFSSNTFDESTIDGYVPGEDYSDSDRIVRSFDTITYDFDFKLSPKDGDFDFDGRVLNVDVELSDEEKEFVSFDKDSPAGERSHTFTFDNIDGYGTFSKSITLYVLNGKNGSLINPKFSIKESTDTENTVILGKNNEENNYTYENDNYKTIPSFTNYMPFIVSSINKELNIELKPVVDNQKANYNDKNGRYLTYVLGVYLNGSNENGIKGLLFPENEINFDVTFNHTGNENYEFDNSWVRTYDSSFTGDIRSSIVDIPYSKTLTTDTNREIKYPGNIEINNEGEIYKIKISEYDFINSFARLNADNSEIDNSKAYLGSYSFTIFSPRTSLDGNNNIVDTMNVSNFNYTDMDNNSHTLNNVATSQTNEYYKTGDYKLDTYFIDSSLEKLANDNTSGSLSRGSTLYYKTEFNYKETNSENGIKEIIKINDNAFRVVPFDNNSDIEIKVECNNKECSNLNKDDFKISFVTGSFSKDNYSLKSSNDRLSEEDLEIVNNTCSNLVLESLSSDQIMNLYGGPCIKAKTDVEKSSNKIEELVDENGSEIPITKIVIQTKEGITLPDDVKITVLTKLRVRNVQDMTRTYQATTTVMTSDYNNSLYYFSPSVTEMINPNNYTLSLGGYTPSKTTNVTYGDSLKIANFTSSQKITVLNKKSDGSMKTNFNTLENETILFNINTKLEDNAVVVGNDDTLYINNIFVIVSIPNTLSHINDADLDKYLINVYSDSNGTLLTYKLPFTKINMEIPDIQFKAKLDSKIVGNVPIVVNSEVYATDINDNRNNEIFGDLTSKLELLALGVNNVVVEEEIGKAGSLVDKNEEFSYILRAYNNTTENIDDYTFMTVLPYNKDQNGSLFNGTYSVKLNIPTNNDNSKIYCSTDKIDELTSNIVWEECNLNEYTDSITAIRIDNVKINSEDYSGDFELFIKPKDNNNSNIYNSNFSGYSDKYSKAKSNTISVSVINRKISGEVFIDNNEDGIKDNSDTRVSDIPVSLFLIKNDEDPILIQDTLTDENGKYIFENLSKGRYYVDINYNNSLYDLTVRYASENTDTDSDAYKVKVNEGIARISNKATPSEKMGLLLTNEIYELNNLDAGLITRKSFGFDIKKYITRVDTMYNGSLDTTDFDNVSTAVISVKNSQKATAKIYYGMAITNNGTVPGYVKEIQEDIPSGLIFDPNYVENEGWIEVDGTLKYTLLSDVVIYPGDTKYLSIVLFMPTREEAGTFINNVSIVSMQKYKEKELSKEAEFETRSDYTIGEDINYAGIGWHVINIEGNGSSQKLTLLADSLTISGNHSLSSGIYKWSTSNANNYLENMFNSSLNKSSLLDNYICDDASGLIVKTNGGELTGGCQSEIYINSKIRLITVKEINNLLNSNLGDLSWLYGTKPFWTESAYKEDSYKAFYVDENGLISSESVTNEYELRPVISIQSNKILYE